MSIESGKEWYALMEQGRYDRAFPWERLIMNFLRWREGEPPLRRTPARRRRPA